MVVPAFRHVPGANHAVTVLVWIIIITALHRNVRFAVTVHVYRHVQHRNAKPAITAIVYRPALHVKPVMVVAHAYQIVLHVTIVTLEAV
jgi:hypothetical protein